MNHTCQLGGSLSNSKAPKPHIEAQKKKNQSRPKHPSLNYRTRRGGKNTLHKIPVVHKKQPIQKEGHLLYSSIMMIGFVIY